MYVWWIPSEKHPIHGLFYMLADRSISQCLRIPHIEGKLLALIPGRPEINELFVGYTHSLCPFTPRPHVSKQLYWVSSLSTEAKSSLPECSGETLFLHFLNFAPLHLDENVLAPYVAFILWLCFSTDTQWGGVEPKKKCVRGVKKKVERKARLVDSDMLVTCYIPGNSPKLGHDQCMAFGFSFWAKLCFSDSIWTPR